MTTDSDLRFALRRALGSLTPGERLALRRRLDGVTQGDMAAVYGVGIDTLRAWERDQLDGVPGVSGVRFRELPLRELLWVAQRRYGVTLAEMRVAFDKSIGWIYNACCGGPGAAQVVRFVLSKG